MSAGADYVLAVTVNYTASGGSAPQLDAHAVYRLFPVPAGPPLVQATADGTNKGRERAVDRTGLGDELGRAVAAKAWAALRQASP